MKWYHDCIVWGVTLGTSLSALFSGPEISIPQGVMLSVGLIIASAIGCVVHAIYLMEKE